MLAVSAGEESDRTEMSGSMIFSFRLRLFYDSIVIFPQNAGDILHSMNVIYAKTFTFLSNQPDSVADHQNYI